jgi:hypothetical protein
VQTIAEPRALPQWLQRLPTPSLFLQTQVEDVAVTIREGVEGSSPHCAKQLQIVPARAQRAAKLATKGAAASEQRITQHPRPVVVIKVRSRHLAAASTRASGRGSHLGTTSTLGGNGGENSSASLRANRVANDRLLPPPLPKRTRTWIASGGKRAVGKGWLPLNPLPLCARSETEVMCELNCKPVYRVAFTSMAAVV